MQSTISLSLLCLASYNAIFKWTKWTFLYVMIHMASLVVGLHTFWLKVFKAVDHFCFPAMAGQ